MQILVRYADEITGRERAECEVLWQSTWPPENTELQGPGYEAVLVAYVLLLAKDGNLAGACSMHERWILVNNEPHRIAGLSSLVVQETHRRQGHGSRMVRAWMKTAGELGYSFGLLFCWRELWPFYERLGWSRLEGEVRYRWLDVDHLARSVMAAPLSPGIEPQFVEWCKARVHLGVGAW